MEYAYDDGFSGAENPKVAYTQLFHESVPSLYELIACMHDYFSL